MATVKPRVNVTLDQSDFDILRTFCQLNQCSMSSYLAEIVKASVPTLVHLSTILSAAEELKGVAANSLSLSANSLSSSLSDAQGVLGGIAGYVSGLSPPQTSPSVCAGDGAGDGDGMDSSPLTINKGVRLEEKTSGVRLFVAGGRDVSKAGKGV